MSNPVHREKKGRLEMSSEDLYTCTVHLHDEKV